MSKRGVNLYLEDIKDSIRWIEKYVTGLSFDDFKKDRRTVDAVVRNLEIIGEAVSNIPKGGRTFYFNDEGGDGVMFVNCPTPFNLSTS